MEVNNIETLKIKSKGRITGFDSDEFITLISKEWDEFFDFLKINNLLKSTPSKLWVKKVDNFRIQQLALGDLLIVLNDMLKNPPGTHGLTYLIPFLTTSNFYFEATATLIEELVDIKNAEKFFNLESQKEITSGRIFKILNECLNKKSLLFKYYDCHIRDGVAHFRLEPTTNRTIQFYNHHYKPTVNLPLIHPRKNNVYDYKRRQLLTYPTLMSYIYAVFQFKLVEHFKKS